MQKLQIGTLVATMSSKEMADLTEKRHDNVKRTIETLVNQGVIAKPQIEYGGKAANGVVEKLYLLGKRDSLIVVAQLCPEFTARIIDRWQELETQTAQPKAFELPDFTNPAIAAIAWANEYQARVNAEATKAQIGSKREATAMATASKAVKEVSRLKDQLGFSVRQATILQVEDATGQDFDFLPLRRWCTANEVVAESVPDKRYPKGVKAWPADAWSACYGVDLSSLFGG